MVFRHYTLRVRHDGGWVSITTVAQSVEAARRVVCASERCPDRSIRRVYAGRVICDTATR